MGIFCKLSELMAQSAARDIASRTCNFLACEGDPAAQMRTVRQAAPERELRSLLTL